MGLEYIEIAGIFDGPMALIYNELWVSAISGQN